MNDLLWLVTKKIRRDSLGRRRGVPRDVFAEKSLSFSHTMGKVFIRNISEQGAVKVLV
jgi:hypothetical protein